MAMTSAQRQQAFRARQKARMDIDPEYATEVKARKAAEGRRYYQKADKSKINELARVRHAKRQVSDPLYRQRKVDEAMAYYWRNRETVLDKKKTWRENTVEQRANYMAQWEKANPDKRKALNLKRYYLMNDTMVEPIDRWRVWVRDSGICGICNEIADATDWHVDHVIPLSKGGSHTYDNVQVSHPLCNIRKGNSLSGSP